LSSFQGQRGWTWNEIKPWIVQTPQRKIGDNTRDQVDIL
jgi:hypothetical protein